MECGTLLAGGTTLGGTLFTVGTTHPHMRAGSAEPRPRTPPVETFACGSPNPVFGKASLGLRPTSGKLADDLEGRLSTGGSERASYGVWL